MNCQDFAQFQRERFRECRKCKTSFHISMFRFVNIHRSRVCNLCWDITREEVAHRAKGRASPHPSIYWWYYDEIMKMGTAGVSPMQMHIAIGSPASLTAFRSWLALHKIPRGRHKFPSVKQVSDEMLEEIRVRIQRRMSYGQIAIALGLKNRNVVAGYVHNYGLRELKERPVKFLAKKDRRRLAASSPVAQPGDRPSVMPSLSDAPDLPSGSDAPVPHLSECA